NRCSWGCRRHHLQSLQAPVGRYGRGSVRSGQGAVTTRHAAEDERMRSSYPPRRSTSPEGTGVAVAKDCAASRWPLTSSNRRADGSKISALTPAPAASTAPEGRATTASCSLKRAWCISGPGEKVLEDGSKISVLL